VYQLYMTYRTAAMSTHAALEELGAKYTLHLIDLSKPRPAEFLLLNPQGKVPVLIHDTGAERRVIFQSAACLLYLAEQHPDQKLAPPAGTPGRALVYQWLFYMAESLQAPFLTYFYTDRFTADSQGLAGVKVKAIDNVDAAWAQLDKALARGPYFLGDAYSIADLYMLTFATWHKDEMKPLSAYPNVRRNLDLVAKRPGVRRMLDANGVGAV
jgi:glutathione S-transferase